MNKKENRRLVSWGWLVSLLVISFISFFSFVLVYFLDHRDTPDANIFALLTASVEAGALSNIPEVIAGILGIAITVVAIVVELASNRYTSRITDLFVKNTVNQLVLGFFVITCFLSVTVSFTGSSSQHLPRYGAIATAGASIVCILLLLPYFAFVFAFLNPHHIVDRMCLFTLAAIKKGGRTRSTRCKQQASLGVEQLSDVALNAIENKDKVICMDAVNTLGKLLLQYQDVKKGCNNAWFVIDKTVRSNPDFVSMQPSVIFEIEKSQIWFEMKILRQYQMLYSETLNRMRDINYLIAINTKKTAEKALEKNDNNTFQLAVRFFNTYMRATINSRDVRTAYNVFNQYRLLAETAIEKQHWDQAVEIAVHFQYYGQLGFSMGLAFILETAAYDLCSLTEMAFKTDAPCKDRLLDIMLQVDKEEEEGHALESSLRGVRKAQIKLASYFLTDDKMELAKKIYEDMKTEIPSRLKSIKEELSKIGAKTFWEISDRGINFDYLEPERRETLELFFSWFENKQLD